jgi:hypothetical protein
VDAFNKTYANELKGSPLNAAELPPHPRMVERINQWLKSKGITLLKNGGFNHYRVAQSLLPELTVERLSAAEIDHFEALFSRVNTLLT